MNDRIFRFGLIGVSLILSSVFGYWLIGGRPHIFWRSDAIYNNLLTLIIPLISSPIIGFIISSIGIGLFKEIFPRKVDFLAPLPEYEQDYLRLIHEKFSNMGSGVQLKDNKYIIANHATVMINHQVLFRQKANEEVLKFTVRRMDLYLAHLNIIFSIIIGIIVGILINLHLYGFPSKEASLVKWLFFVLVLLYVIIGYRQGRKALKEVNSFEKKFLLTCKK